MERERELPGPQSPPATPGSGAGTTWLLPLSLGFIAQPLWHPPRRQLELCKFAALVISPVLQLSTRRAQLIAVAVLSFVMRTNQAYHDIVSNQLATHEKQMVMSYRNVI